MYALIHASVMLQSFEGCDIGGNDTAESDTMTLMCKCMAGESSQFKI